MSNHQLTFCLVALLAVPGAAAAQPDAGPAPVPRVPLAGIHTRSAHAAAARGDCRTARTLGAKVRELDPEYYLAVFAIDPVITGCVQGEPAEPDRVGGAPADEDAGADRTGFVSAGLRIWTNIFALDLVGIELGSDVTRHVAVTFDYASNVDGELFAAHVLRAGVRVTVLPGDLSPYLNARAGMLVVRDGGVEGLWTAGGGLQAHLPRSGVVLDAGLGVVGAFGESGQVREVALGVGKRF